MDGSVVLDGAVIAPEAVVVDSVVGADAYIGDRSSLTRCVIGDRARLGRDIELREGARVWPDVALVDGAVRFSTDA